MLRHALPGLGNNWQVMQKSTALVSIIGLSDLTWLADQAGRSTHQPFVFYAVVCVLSFHDSGLGHPLPRPRTALQRRYTTGRGMIEWAVITENLPEYAAGLWLTLQLTVISLAAGLLLAIPLAVLRTSGAAFVSRGVWAYTYFFRGTPMLVQLLLVYHGLGQFEGPGPLGRGATACGWCSGIHMAVRW